MQLELFKLIRNNACEWLETLFLFMDCLGYDCAVCWGSFYSERIMIDSPSLIKCLHLVDGRRLLLIETIVLSLLPHPCVSLIQDLIDRACERNGTFCSGFVSTVGSVSCAPSWIRSLHNNQSFLNTDRKLTERWHWEGNPLLFLRWILAFQARALPIAFLHKKTCLKSRPGDGEAESTSSRH